MSTLQNSVHQEVRHLVLTTENMPEFLTLHSACKHFGSWNNYFRKHKKFIITEQLNNVKTT